MSRVRRSCRRVTLHRSCSSPDQWRLLGALGNRHDGALGGAGIELAWAGEPGFRIGYHLVPMGNPADRAGDGEDRVNIAGGSPSARKMMPE